MFDPEQGGAVQQQVAQGAATEGRYERHDKQADQIHVAPPCLEKTGEGKRKDADGFNESEQVHGERL